VDLADVALSDDLAELPRLLPGAEVLAVGLMHEERSKESCFRRWSTVV